MEWPERLWAAPLMIVRQLTDLPVSAVLVGGVSLALVVWIASRRPAWSAVWPVLLTPMPWIVLIVWAASHWREEGPQTGFHADAWALLMLGVTLAVSVWAVARAKRIQLPVAGLCILNALFALLAALFAVMMTTGAWL